MWVVHLDVPINSDVWNFLNKYTFHPQLGYDVFFEQAENVAGDCALFDTKFDIFVVKKKKPEHRCYYDYPCGQIRVSDLRTLHELQSSELT